VSPLAGVKSISSLERVLAWEEARARDFHESIMLNERGEVASTTRANIFWVKEGTVHTPSPATGAVGGVTRERIIALAGELAIPLVEGVYELNDLTDAEEVFLTSADLGIGVVNTFDFHRYALTAGSVTTILREAFRQAILSSRAIPPI
jgi:4-amino-4-deoxychorismate lyase